MSATLKESQCQLLPLRFWVGWRRSSRFRSRAIGSARACRRLRARCRCRGDDRGLKFGERRIVNGECVACLCWSVRNANSMYCIVQIRDAIQHLLHKSLARLGTVVCCQTSIELNGVWPLIRSNQAEDCRGRAIERIRDERRPAHGGTESLSLVDCQEMLMFQLTGQTSRDNRLKDPDSRRSKWVHTRMRLRHRRRWYPRKRLRRFRAVLAKQSSGGSGACLATEKRPATHVI